jgi:hypothetical protein
MPTDVVKGRKDAFAAQLIKEKECAICCDHAYRYAFFSGNIRFLGSYVAYARSKDREFYKV